MANVLCLDPLIIIIIANKVGIATLHFVVFGCSCYIIIANIPFFIIIIIIVIVVSMILKVYTLKIINKKMNNKQRVCVAIATSN